MTEEQARTKWCPMVRFSMSEDDNNSCNNRTLSPEVRNCIAYDCMMWRTARKSSTDKPIVEVGYCGLAGKP